MIRALLDRFAIRPFEARFDYDASYMRDLLAASPAAFWGRGVQAVSRSRPRRCGPGEPRIVRISAPGC